MNLEQASAFATFAVVAAITPGPSNVMLAATGAVAGIARGLRCLAGVTLGMGLLMLVVGLGLGALITQHPLILSTMRWAGATLLLWLSRKIATAPYAAATGTEAAEPIGFVGGFSFQWLNPKSWLVTTPPAPSSKPAPPWCSKRWPSLPCSYSSSSPAAWSGSASAPRCAASWIRRRSNAPSTSRWVFFSLYPSCSSSSRR